MSHMNNLNFPDYMFALSLLHTIEDNFGKRKLHKMQELSIPREQMNWFWKRVHHSCVALP